MVRKLNQHGYPVKQSALSRYLTRNPITKEEIAEQISIQEALATKDSREELLEKIEANE